LTGDPTIPFKGMPSVTWRPSTKPYHLKVPQPPSSVTWTFGGHLRPKL
jgi:hypothetical protein